MIAKAVVGHYLYKIKTGDFDKIKSDDFDKIKSDDFDKIKTGDKSSPEDLSPLKNSN